MGNDEIVDVPAVATFAASTEPVAKSAEQLESEISADKTELAKLESDVTTGNIVDTVAQVPAAVTDATETGQTVEEMVKEIHTMVSSWDPIIKDGVSEVVKIIDDIKTKGIMSILSGL
jgi:urease gamma subunit